MPKASSQSQNCNASSAHLRSLSNFHLLTKRANPFINALFHKRFPRPQPMTRLKLFYKFAPATLYCAKPAHKARLQCFKHLHQQALQLPLPHQTRHPFIKPLLHKGKQHIFPRPQPMTHQNYFLDLRQALYCAEPARKTRFQCLQAFTSAGSPAATASPDAPLYQSLLTQTQPAHFPKTT